ncbi:MAG: NADP-dependent malic enzyme [Candidatus Micrarchaeaceae archaeon]
MINKKIALQKHKENNGKIQIVGKVKILKREDLSTYYTPGVAFVSEEIKKNKDLAYEYTNKSNTIAILSDGTRILGLGNIGPEAGLPVMEGKSLLFKKYGGVDAIPLCIGTTEEDEIIKTAKYIAPSIGGINIEDIESPKSFRIIEKLEKELDIPIFHDDQYGTAVVCLGALTNALKLAKKGKRSKIIIFGAGSAGYGITKLLSYSGFNNIYVFDSKGIITKNRKEDMNEFKNKIAHMTNGDNKYFDVEDAVKNADVLIGVSGKKGYFKKEWISKMNDKPIIFALTNPDPEIEYNEAVRAGAFVVATGKSNSPNQVNNVMAFPGVMRGLLEVRAKKISMPMLYSAAMTIAKSAKKGLSVDRIIPSAIDEKVMKNLTLEIAGDVGISAIKDKNARIKISKEEIKKRSMKKINDYIKLESYI